MLVLGIESTAHTFGAAVVTGKGKILSIALRQGIFIGLTVIIILLFYLLGILTWWIGLLIFLVFVLIEIALQY